MKTQPHPYDRHHLKEVLHKNDMLEGMEAATAWAKAHLELLLVGVVLAAAVAFGVVTWVQSAHRRAVESSSLLADAEGMLGQAESQPPSTAAGVFSQAYAKFQAVATDYDGTAAARSARLGMANVDLATGKAADAAKTYALLDTHAAGDPIASLAGLGLAQALEAQGDTAGARAAYAAVLADDAAGVGAPQAQARLKALGGAPAAASSAVPTPSVK